MDNAAPRENSRRYEYFMDRQEILDCFTRLCRGSDREDRELFLSAFHSDAIIDVGEFVGSPEGLYEWSSAMQAHGQSSHHHILNHSCEIDGDVAHAETYYFFVARGHDDTNAVMGGRYVCRLERRNGIWGIAMHCNVVEWAGTLPTMAIPFENVADLRANGGPARSKDDISYRRPLTNRRAMHLPRN